MKNFIQLILNCLAAGFMLWIGCDLNSGNGKAVTAESNKATPTEDTTINDSISIRRREDEWNIDTAIWKGIPKKWVKLERTKRGYVVYEPCAGPTPSVDLNSLKLIIDGKWQDGPTSYSIKHFQKTKENEYQIIAEGEGRATVRLKMKLVQSGLNLWLFSALIYEPKFEKQDSFKWVMTTKTNSKNFPVVKNPCPDHKIDEKEFLPIEFNN